MTQLDKNYNFVTEIHEYGTVVCFGQELNTHPKIYLSLNETNQEAICPYCSKKFILSSKKNGS